MEETVSAYKYLGIPETLSNTLTLILFGLTLSAYLAGADFGIFKIPEVGGSIKKPLKFIAPILLILCFLGYIPLIKQTTKEDAVCSRIRNEAKELAQTIEEDLPQINDDMQQLQLTASAAHCNEIARYKCDYIIKDSVAILDVLLTAKKQLPLWKK